MRPRAIYVSAVVSYLFMLGALVAIFDNVLDESVRMQFFYMISSGLMAITMIFAILIMRANRNSIIMEEYEKRYRRE